jgi:hypothetical protein
VQWFFACLFNNALSITPRRNLVSNIGLVGTHTSADRSNHEFPVFGVDPGELVAPAMVFPERRYDHVFFSRQFAPPRTFGGKVADAARRVLGGRRRPA